MITMFNGGIRNLLYNKKQHRERIGERMKNKSLQNPFPTMVDKFFDKNKDGKLGYMETIFRDAHLKEMEQKEKQAKKSKK